MYVGGRSVCYIPAIGHAEVRVILKPEKCYYSWKGIGSCAISDERNTGIVESLNEFENKERHSSRGASEKSLTNLFKCREAFHLTNEVSKKTNCPKCRPRGHQESVSGPPFSEENNESQYRRKSLGCSK